MSKKITNLNTASALIDRLIIEVCKVSYLENLKRAEQQKDLPNAKKIAEWDNASRNANECRAALKTEIDNLLSEIIAKGEYITIEEGRTF